jgi:hypothetical protein
MTKQERDELLELAKSEIKRGFFKEAIAKSLFVIADSMSRWPPSEMQVKNDSTVGRDASFHLSGPVTSYYKGPVTVISNGDDERFRVRGDGIFQNSAGADAILALSNVQKVEGDK